jgi:hypothetical protein
MKDLLKKTIEAAEFLQSNVDKVLEEIKFVAAMGALLELFTLVPFKLVLSSDRSSH